MRKKGIAACLLAVICLAGCEKMENDRALTVNMVTVRYWNGEELLFSSDVERGQTPEVYVPEIRAGLSFLGWDREIEAACDHGDYYGTFAPTLSGHDSYLFPDENGLLHPDAPFSGSDLSAALRALTEPEAEAYFPPLPEGDSISAGELKTVLSVFFPRDFQKGFEGFADGQELTRGEASVIINRLLCRENEKVAVAKRIPFPDLSPKHPYYCSLMEAACTHRPGGATWENVEFHTGKAPGWEIREGIARYYDEDGYLVVNTELPGGLMLDQDGCFTSGNGQLDAYVREILASLQEQYPDADRMTLLKKAYLYVRDGFRYVRREFIEYGLYGWETEYALSMFENGVGNCYYYAAAFAVLARGLGYDAWAVSGKLLWEDYSGSEPHGWVEIQWEDGIYCYDPEAEMAMRREGRCWNLFHMARTRVRNVAYLERDREESDT